MKSLADKIEYEIKTGNSWSIVNGLTCEIKGIGGIWLQWREKECQGLTPPGQWRSLTTKG